MAWFDNVDPFLLEDDVIMPGDQDTVDVDMDQVDDICLNKNKYTKAQQLNKEQNERNRM